MATSAPDWLRRRKHGRTAESLRWSVVLKQSWVRSINKQYSKRPRHDAPDALHTPNLVFPGAIASGDTSAHAGLLARTLSTISIILHIHECPPTTSALSCLSVKTPWLGTACRPWTSWQGGHRWSYRQVVGNEA